MITLDQINGEISGLEQETPTHETMRKLASLYTVRDHMVLQPVAPVASDIPHISETDFAKAIEGMQISTVMAVMDELMDTLQIINPNLYSGVMRKISRG